MTLTSILQSVLALYGIGERAHHSRRRPAPILIAHRR